MKARLTEIQNALTNLLGHGSEVAQEMASRGLSVVYGMADEAGKKELLDNLMGTLQGGRRPFLLHPVVCLFSLCMSVWSAFKRTFRVKS